MFKLDLEKAEEQEIKFPTSVGSLKSETVPEKHLLLNAKAFDCVDHNILENSERDGNTTPPDLPPENLYAG